MSLSHATDALSRVDPLLLARVQDLMETAVRQIRSHLINRIGVTVPVRFGDVATIPCGELEEQFLEEGAGVFVRFAFEPGGLQGVLAIDGQLLSRIMGLLLGEDPYADPAPYVWRPPTRMDLAVAERLATDVFAGLLDSLPSQTGGKLKILDVSGNPRVDLPMPPQAGLLDITLDFGPPEDPYGLVTLALPASFATTLWPDAARSRPSSTQGVSRVLPLPVTLVAELGRVSLPLGQVESLHEGAVIPLGTPRTVTVSVAGRPAVLGEAGVVDGQRCVRVLRKHAPA